MRMQLAALAAAALTACGGGGDGPIASDQSFPAREALSRFLEVGGSVTASVSQPDGMWTATQTVAPGQPASLMGSAPLPTAAVVARIDRGQTYMSGSDSTYYLSGGPGVLHGYETSRHRATYTIDAPLPVTATVGESGPFLHYTSTSVTDPDQAVSDGRVTWELKADTATTALLCLHFELKSLQSIISGLTTRESDCYRIDAAGNVSGATFTLPVDGEVWTFR